MIVCGFVGVNLDPSDLRARVERFPVDGASVRLVEAAPFSLAYVDSHLRGRVEPMARSRGDCLFADVACFDGFANAAALLEGRIPFADRRLQGAAAMWEASDERLTLWRSPMSNRPWFWRRTRGGLLFANAVPLLRDAQDDLDIGYLANVASWSWTEPGSTAFVEIRAIPPAGRLLFEKGRVALSKIWTPSSMAGDRRRGSTDARAIRDAFASSVERSLHDGGGLIASQLSGGRDSSAVTCVAAALAGKEHILAVTAAPAAGYDGPPVGDESASAARTARAAGVRHLVVRTDGEGVASRLDRLTGYLGAPLGNLPALNWWDELAATARREGAERILVGELGNFTINLGGPDALPDLIREGHYRAFARELLPTMRMAGVLPTLANLMPRLALSRPGAWLRAAVRGYRRQPSRMIFLRGEMRLRADDARRSAASAGTLPLRYRERMAALLERAEPNDMPTIWSHRVDIRDPTADQTLAEHVMALPATALISGGEARPMFAAAFGDLVPDEVTSSRVRGRQGADWYRQFPRKEVAAALERYREAQSVREWIDLGEMARFLDRWPSDYRGSIPVQNEGMDFLNALGLAAFLYWETTTRPS